MSKEFLISDITTGKLNALVKKIMKQTGSTDPEEAIRHVNSGEYVVMLPPLLSESEGIVTYSVISDGTTPLDWHNRLKKNFQVGFNAKLALSDPLTESFMPTNGTKRTLVILKGKLFRKKDRTFEKIKEFAASRNMITPHAEVSCLLREKLTNDEIKAMGLRTIIVMHEPIMTPYFLGTKGPYFHPYYLALSTDSAEHGGYLSDRLASNDDIPMEDTTGFVFEIPS